MSSETIRVASETLVFHKLIRQDGKEKEASPVNKGRRIIEGKLWGRAVQVALSRPGTAYDPYACLRLIRVCFCDQHC
ncbi:hypothetical protein QUC31_003331 [Theobroma cacao]